MKSSLVAVIVLLLAGCAGQAIRPDDTTTVVAQPDQVIMASVAQKPCQPIDAAYRVRDLTKPWSQRRYLLPSND